MSTEIPEATYILYTILVMWRIFISEMIFGLSSLPLTQSHSLEKEGLRGEWSVGSDLRVAALCKDYVSTQSTPPGPASDGG